MRGEKKRPAGAEDAEDFAQAIGATRGREAIEPIATEEHEIESGIAAAGQGGCVSEAVAPRDGWSA